MVVIKPAQVGCSELAITRVLHALDVGAQYWQTDKDGLNVGYLFPTKDALEAFSKERFGGIRGESDHLTSLFSGYDGTDFKQAGRSYLYLRGMNSESGLLSFPADMLVYDEYDRMPARSIALALARLRASSVHREFKLSTPTLPGRGIHDEYLQSDQHVWEVQCEHCRAWSALEFFRDVRVAGQAFDQWRYWSREEIEAATCTMVCPLCADAIDRCGPGRWRALAPHITTRRGYHVPWYAFASIGLTGLCIKATSDDPEKQAEFFRSDLGQPYTPTGSRVTLPMLQQLHVELPHGELPEDATWQRTAMGVDVGTRLHYRIDSDGPQGRTVRAMGAVRTWEELSELLRLYRVRQCVIDAYPEQHACADWSAKHPGRVRRADYPNGLRELYTLPADPTDDTVRIHRTMAMDAVFAAIKSGAEHWPLSITRQDEVQRHLTAPVRQISDRGNGEPVVSWAHTAPDHLFHASVYCHIATLLLPKATSMINPLVQAKTKGWQPR